MNCRVKKCKFKPKTRRDMRKNGKNGMAGQKRNATKNGITTKAVKIELDTREPNQAFVSLDPKIHNCQDYIPIIFDYSHHHIFYHDRYFFRGRRPKAFPKLEWQKILGIGSKFVCFVVGMCLSRYARIKKRSFYITNCIHEMIFA
jgi:hypothetical protein